MAKTYTVKKGDTLWDIAKEYLGAGIEYKKLATWNNINNSDLIYVGQVLYVEPPNAGTGFKASTSTVTITHFGLQSNSENTLFVMWDWNKSQTDKYLVKWEYMLDDLWFANGSSPTSISVDENDPSSARCSTYGYPDGAKKVRVKIRPISKTKTVNEVETSYWTAAWSKTKTYYPKDAPPKAPSAPAVTIDGRSLTAKIEDAEDGVEQIEFEIVENDSKVYKRGKANVSTKAATYKCTVNNGCQYKVRCRGIKDGESGDWSAYSSNTWTSPSAPSGFTICRAQSETSVYLAWDEVDTAISYDIEHATEKRYFDGSDQTTKVTGIEFTHYEITGLKTGKEYFFRFRAVNSVDGSEWSEISSVVLGSKPEAPTTWSSTTTAIVGEPLNLYWMHNAEDGSKQTSAQIELDIDGVIDTIEVRSSTDDDDEDAVSVYSINTSSYNEGATIKWRVCTAGITNKLGEWSIQRTIDLYAPATLEVTVMDADGNAINTIESFPFRIYALAGPESTKQWPIGYHVTITANETYTTTDQVGNSQTVPKGSQVYSKHFDITGSLLIDMSAGNIDLENNIGYTVTCVVSMSSGLTAEATSEFVVSWEDVMFEPNAEIGIDSDTIVAHIRPYCRETRLVTYEVTKSYSTYTKTDTVLGYVYGEPVANAKTTTGEQVYSGFVVDTAEEVAAYYCMVEEGELVEDTTLSVYRREFDGSFTELATGIDNLSNTTITDPHPALDYARYRIVAISNSTGAVSYTDLPGYPTGEKSIIIQWDEQWTNFEVSTDDVLEQPAWSGSLLRLPYNVDVSDDTSPEVELVEYIGRKHPVSYYGTQMGATSTWNATIDKQDKETIYALRRLAVWMGDVYVREPSGTGYWANITVSFSQKHCDTTIPVTLNITRVAGDV